MEKETKLVKRFYDNTKTQRIGNALKMLDILKAAAEEDKILSANQLKEKLGIENKGKTNRKIYYYRETLELFGYNIKSYGGPDGGYKLMLPNKLTNEEINYLGQLIPAGKVEILEKIKKLNK